jgi:hypothetical protein
MHVWHNTYFVIKTPRPTKCTILFADILYYIITLNSATCFDPQGIIIRELNQSNTAQTQQHLHKIEMCKKSKCLTSDFQL